MAGSAGDFSASISGNRLQEDLRATSVSRRSSVTSVWTMMLCEAEIRSSTFSDSFDRARVISMREQYQLHAWHGGEDSRGGED